MFIETDFKRELPEGFSWLNEPQQVQVANGLHITTEPKTDFWQRTHYGFQFDSGHALLSSQPGDFEMRTHVRFEPNNQYDQCGLYVRLDTDNWIKLSTEYISPRLSMLGAVVTNLGYSDWSTMELDHDPGQMWYQINKNGSDFLLQASADGRTWQQLRIAHLHAPCQSIQAGIYACTPKDGQFTCTFTRLIITENSWARDS
jgi:regulation of enolase protein 1 (concanavalin A-like superfamily)